MTKQLMNVTSSHVNRNEVAIKMIEYLQAKVAYAANDVNQALYTYPMTIENWLWTLEKELAELKRIVE